MSEISIYDELSLLYLQNQNIKDLSPAQLYDKYREVIDEIRSEAKNYKKGPAVLK